MERPKRITGRLSLKVTPPSEKSVPDRPAKVPLPVPPRESESILGWREIPAKQERRAPAPAAKPERPRTKTPAAPPKVRQKGSVNTFEIMRHPSIQAMASRWPKVFDPKQPLPLAIGSGEIIKAALEGDEGAGPALGRWTRRNAYRRAIAAAGSMRHDLDGNPVEPVSEEHRRDAAAILAKR